MKTKFLLPVLAMVFAIGMSFATGNQISDPSTDYVLENGSFEALGMEIDCKPGEETCKVQIEQNGPIYEVYDAAHPNSAKPGTGRVYKLWQ